MFKLTNHYEEIAEKRSRFLRVMSNYHPADCSKAILKNLS
jgi:hypothetical protein